MLAGIEWIQAAVPLLCMQQSMISPIFNLDNPKKLMVKFK